MEKWPTTLLNMPSSKISKIIHAKQGNLYIFFQLKIVYYRLQMFTIYLKVNTEIFDCFRNELPVFRSRCY